MTDLAAPEARMAAAAAACVAAMPEQLRAECEALVALDPEVRGVRVFRDDERDLFHLVWVNRWIGSVPGAHVRGEV